MLETAPCSALFDPPKPLCYLSVPPLPCPSSLSAIFPSSSDPSSHLLGAREAFECIHGLLCGHRCLQT